jgi:hypothetical protein
METLLHERDQIEENFKNHYPYEEDTEDHRIYFTLPDSTTFRVDRFGRKDNMALVLSYWNDTNTDLCGDGDVYYFSDYTTLDDMFEALLSETKRPV